jgi:acylglycerol lipase
VKRRAFLLGALGLSGCAPMVQQARLKGDQPPPRPMLQDNSFTSFDGARLPLRRWEAAGEPWGVIVGLHGMNDYSNAFHLAGPWWAARGITTYAYDQRGFGHAPERGVWGGDLMMEDLRVITALVRARHPRAVITVAGVSMGGAVAIEAFASQRPPAADRLVLLAPAVWGWSTQSLPNRTLLWLAAHTIRGKVLEPPAFVTRKIRASDNIEELIRMGRDPQLIWGARPDAIYGLVNLMEAASRDIGRLAVPTLYASGAHDQIITPKPTRRAASRLPARARSAFYPHGWHLLLVDHARETVFADVESFIRSPLAPLPSGVGPIPLTAPRGASKTDAAPT